MLNPFLGAFPAAVAFKAEWAIERVSMKELTIEHLFQHLRDELQPAFEEAEHDVFLYPNKGDWRNAENTFQILTEIVAILSFVPGGIEMFGQHYEIFGGKLLVTANA